jgi:hypothetical protein
MKALAHAIVIAKTPNKKVPDIVADGAGACAIAYDVGKINVERNGRSFI